MSMNYYLLEGWIIHFIKSKKYLILKNWTFGHGASYNFSNFVGYFPGFKTQMRHFYKIKIK